MAIDLKEQLRAPGRSLDSETSPVSALDGDVANVVVPS